MQKNDKITAIIIDDDEFCCYQLQELLGRNVKDVELLAVCNSGAEGLEQIRRYDPELVFLDVEMPGMDGFEMLRMLPATRFHVIFTSMHSHYAIRAIRFSAVDYLVKPVEAAALQEAVSRVKEKINTGQQQQMEVIAPPAEMKKTDTLAVPVMEGLLFISTDDIIRCESDDKYTKIFLADKKMIVASRTLGDFETVLKPYSFLRVHRSYLINLKHLKKYLRGEGGQVIMSDGATVDVSRSKKEELLKLVSQF
jgi:two-component system LytT family response regulator